MISLKTSLVKYFVVFVDCCVFPSAFAEGFEVFCFAFSLAAVKDKFLFVRFRLAPL
jgi:hypothetical protein